MSLTENRNKENIPITISPQKTKSIAPDQINQQQQNQIISQLESDVKRLEKLYKDEVLKSQSTLNEQEKLELDLLKKEKQILSQQQSLQKLQDLNKSLSKKLSGEVSYYENIINNYKINEKQYDEKILKLRNGHLKFEHMLKQKNDELLEINQELEVTKNDLDLKSMEFSQLQHKLNTTFKKLDDLEASIPEPRGEPIHTFTNLDDDSDEEEGASSSDDELNSLIINEEDDDEDEFNDTNNDNETSNEQYDITDNSSMNLTNEINDQINEKSKVIKKYQFEIKSLKNEKIQLYTYINKLLKNKPHEDQNSILKEKLVKRKILRTISINQVLNNQKVTNSPRPKSKGKRVISNYVNFKNYGNISKRSLQFEKQVQNSDNEDDNTSEVDEDELRILGNQNLGHTFFLKSKYLMTPLDFLISKTNGNNELDLDID
ncbi:Serine/threonine-protein kinase [Wickerhamomyces ciferrii]|uniref:Serine/threonine-protein kinase n=1 Tax=Wickerhamomyces ciferrii (strain ATCC 14091 / BCRC 22168 / CBS 111 / JCM 3599 / NBRC 0793 / NRRL Y-1031 F-60-10) TaxID=1206466 RepID=K0KUT9_WICCF|nr:Serine/threonine-protein kinase [Wickerhamomyces ciferrii]CCH46981.1 Serine/threonine-protein kinase [Wickerhamomyces ciferrii]